MAVPEKSREIRLEPLRDRGDLAMALAIREIVFIEEQQVPMSVERDEEDARAYHVLAFDGGHAIGTGRLVTLSEPPPGEAGLWGRIGRMAVLDAYRKRRLGTRILEALETEAARQGMTGIVLHAQLHAKDFYVRFGYQGSGPIFDEAGMPHMEMRKPLPPRGGLY